jgi:hypothetical protein
LGQEGLGCTVRLARVGFHLWKTVLEGPHCVRFIVWPRRGRGGPRRPGKAAVTSSTSLLFICFSLPNISLLLSL